MIQQQQSKGGGGKKEQNKERANREVLKEKTGNKYGV